MDQKWAQNINKSLIQRFVHWDKSNCWNESIHMNDWSNILLGPKMKAMFVLLSFIDAGDLF